MQRQLLASLLLGLLAVSVASAQEPASEDPRYRIRTTVDLVVVPVSVKDSDGRLVQDLKRDDFRVLDDGEEQKITLFSIDPFPLSALILVDSGLSANAMDQVKRTLPALTGAFGPFDEFSLYTFDSVAIKALDWTSDIEALNKTVERLQAKVPSIDRAAAGGPMTSGPRINSVPVGPPIGTTQRRSPKPIKAIDDALFTAALELRQRERGRRKIVFIVSDGLNSRSNLNSYDDTVKLLLGNDVSVYAIGVGEAAWFNRLSNMLAKYATVTGGDVVYAVKKQSLEPLYARMAAQARNQYTLGYVPKTAAKLGDYRRIEVRIRRPGLTVLARDGYYPSPRMP